jgi:aminopeptidase N
MSTTTPKGIAEVEQPSYKLPTTVVPSHYKIHQFPSFKNFRCQGEVTIDIDVASPVSSITLHARDLIITSAYVEHANGTCLDAIMGTATVKLTDALSGKQVEKTFASAASLDADNERATFKFDGVLGKGAWKLHIDYSASMVQPSLEGFYRSKWVDDAGAEHWMASTQLAATQARVPSPVSTNRPTKPRSKSR